MIVRILGEGQWELADDHVNDLNGLDDAIEKAVAGGDEVALTEALHAMLSQVRTVGTPVPDEEIKDSDLILPAADSSLAEVQALLSGSSEGLIPG
ncbi:MAG: hypothetical protein QOF52_111 [Propionibacteriaceae bacterium]|nr:synthase [Propionibacteriaceae bacterium]MDX6320253.1 hypothetical protein [Propionibacteriaceae bacterium]